MVTIPLIDTTWFSADDGGSLWFPHLAMITYLAPGFQWCCMLPLSYPILFWLSFTSIYTFLLFTANGSLPKASWFQALQYLLHICLVFSSRLTFNTMVFSSTPTSKYNNIGYCTCIRLSCFVLLTKDSLALVALKVLIFGWLLILWLYDWKEGDLFAPYHHTCT